MQLPFKKNLTIHLGAEIAEKLRKGKTGKFDKSCHSNRINRAEQVQYVVNYFLGWIYCEQVGFGIIFFYIYINSDACNLFDGLIN